MHVVAFSTFVIKADDTFSVLNIDHPVFEPVGRWRHRRWNLPDNKLEILPSVSTLLCSVSFCAFMLSIMPTFYIVVNFANILAGLQAFALETLVLPPEKAL